jgi:hypothetical protein
MLSRVLLLPLVIGAAFSKRIDASTTITDTCMHS